MRSLALIAIFFASVASAQEGLRASDVKLGQVELADYLSDQGLEFYTDGFATYHADGTYDYRYSADGERVPGTYEVMDDSRVCTAFVTGFARCDYIVQAGQRHVMIIENGERYPIKSRTALSDG